MRTGWTRMSIAGLVVLGASVAAGLLGGCPVAPDTAAPNHDAKLVGKWWRAWSIEGLTQELEVMSWQLNADGTGTEHTINVQTLEPDDHAFTWTAADDELTMTYVDNGVTTRMQYLLDGAELDLAGFTGDSANLQVLVKDSQERDPRLVGDWFMTDALEYAEDTHAAWGVESIYRADGTGQFVSERQMVDDQPTYQQLDAVWYTSGDYVLLAPAAQPDMMEVHPYQLSLDGTTLTETIPEVGGINTIVGYKTLGEHDSSLVGRWVQTGHTQDGETLAFEPVTWTFNADGSGARDYQNTTDDTLTWETNTGTRLFIQKQDATLLGYGYSVAYSIVGDALTLTYSDVESATPVDMADTYQKQQ